jgi:hypothetical protein
MFQSCGGIALRRAEAGGGLRGLARQRKGHRGAPRCAQDTFLTLGMRRWRLGMRLRNVRTPGEGGAGGRQNSVGESLLHGQSAVGPNARGACCHRRLIRAASLIVITLSSIGLWVAICGALTAVLR